MMGIIGQDIYLVVVADCWPRVRTLWTGSVLLSIIISVCIALSAEFGSTDAGNPARARTAIDMIYSGSIRNLLQCHDLGRTIVPPELLPFFLQSKGLAFAMFCKSVVGVVLSEVTPMALENVSRR